MRLDHLLSKETEEVGVALLLICQRGKSRKRIMNWWLCAKRIAGEEIRNKNRQAEYLQTGKSERTAVRAAKCVTDYGHENTDVDFRKDKGRDKPLSTFLQASEIKTRQCIYISREIHEKVAIVTSRMGNGLSIGKFVDNILRDHFRQYGQQYMEQIENAQKVRL